jgi:hypothetical protein
MPNPGLRGASMTPIKTKLFGSECFTDDFAVMVFRVAGFVV